MSEPRAHWEELLQSVSNFIFRLITCKHCGRTPRGARDVKRSQSRGHGPSRPVEVGREDVPSAPSAHLWKVPYVAGDMDLQDL
jgi:hypothetical protein